MYRKRDVDRKIKDHFGGRNYFTRDELYRFYLQYEPSLNPKTFGWRVFDLKKKNIISGVKRGVYIISDKQPFSPEIDNNIKEIAAHLTKRYAGAEWDYRLWTTKWINRFSHHLPFTYFYVVEFPFDQTESAFYVLYEKFPGKVFHRPDKELMLKNVVDLYEPIVVTNMIHRSPLQTLQGIKTPPIEKILVDLYVDSNLFYYYQGAELGRIYEKAMSLVSINYTRMLNYARRRGKHDEIKQFLNSILPEERKDIIND